MPKALAITCADYTAAALREVATRGNDADATRRMLALALVLEGYKRGEAGKLCGMDRQTLRDWVIRYNAEGIAGLCNRIAAGPKPRLNPEQEAAVAELVRKGPDLRGRGSLAPGESGPRDQGAVQCDLGRAQRRRDAAPSRLSAAVGAAATSATGPGGAGDTQKNFADLVKAVIPEHAREKPIELWWQDEARVGQQGTLTRVWAERGSRPAAPRDQRREWAYIFGAVCPRRDIGAALVLPYANAEAMNLHLEEIGSQVTPGSHAVLLLDGAGWHQTGGKLRVPKNISLLHPPPYSPELNPVENIWQFLRQNHLGNRVFESYAAIVDACCAAWNALVAEPGHITSITTRDWASVIT